MPELPEVETIKNALNLAVRGAKITRAEVKCRQLRMEVPRELEDIVANTTIKSFRRIAKYIIVELDNGFSLIWHMGMSGRVKINLECPQILEKHDHVIIHTNKGCVIFNDPRRFGLLTYCKSAEAHKHPLMQNNGLDPFDSKLNERYLFEKFKNKKVAVKVALLDQTIISGVGNIYASEALYEARIMPTRPAQNLTLSECGRLIVSLRKVLQSALKSGGSTLKDYHLPDGSMGYFQSQHCVYGKTGQICPVCRTNHKETSCIQKVVLGGRSTFYCKNIQK